MVTIVENTVLDCLAKAKFFESQALNNKKLADDAITTAKKMIESGKGTGNTLRDYVIVAFGKDSDKLVYLLKALNYLVNESVGELMLISHTWEESSIKKLEVPNKKIIDGGYKVMMQTQYLGILNGTELVIDPRKKSCDFPVENFLERGDSTRASHSDTQMSPGNALIQNILSQEEKTFLGRIAPLHHFQLWEYKIGFFEIGEWIKKNPTSMDNVIGMLVELGYPPNLRATTTKAD